jgi:SAM-dependent methyltransferase
MTLERQWDRRVQQWHSHVNSAAGFEQLLDRLIEVASPQPADSCVDLGAGTGFVTIALAPLVRSVLAVDISAAMASALTGQAAASRLENVSTQVTDLRTLKLPPTSADLVVSSYALHHLADADKRALAARAAQWLRPGGAGSPLSCYPRHQSVSRRQFVDAVHDRPGGLDSSVTVMFSPVTPGEASIASAMSTISGRWMALSTSRSTPRMFISASGYHRDKSARSIRLWTA